MSNVGANTNHIIFDYDGVLIDSFDFHLRKNREVLGVEMTPEEYADIHDGNFYTNTAKKYTEVDFSVYADAVSVEQSMLPLAEDAKRVLEKLSEDRTLHLVTSGWRTQVEPFLEHNNIQHLFASCFFAEDGLAKHDKFSALFSEHNTSAEKCVYVTDTVGDIKEAHAVNLPSIAVTFGYHDRARLERAAPARVVDSWREVYEVLMAER